MCEEKKIEIALDETKYSTDKKINVTTKKLLKETLDSYRNWLLQLTVVDPACGSGAFLNQALEFLIAEHKYVDELQAKLFGDALVLSDVEGSILENNLFGVDLNEESVEIAKLSLWLRTAQRNRKLNSLNNNIKCGNSLIDDVAVAGDKAFHWQNEFPQVFKEKIKKAFHLVFTTHNSRVSLRMIEYKVKKGEALELDLEHEIELTKIFKQIIKENNYNCLAYNICKDHVHLIIVCEEEELVGIAKVLKGKSSYLYQFNGFKPIGEALWSQKFFFAQLDELVWSDVCPMPGYLATDTYLENAIAYIKTNRNKHHLPDSKELKNHIDQFVIDLDVAFATEYNGGFDVVIGNPPYVSVKMLNNNHKEFYSKNYETSRGQFDLYTLFYEKGYNILKTDGILSFITSNTFISNKDFFEFRKFILSKSNVSEILNLGETVFIDANIDVAILTFRKNKDDQEILICKNRVEFDKKTFTLINQNNFISDNFEMKINIHQSELKLIKKINAKKEFLSEILELPRGIEFGSNSEKIFENKILNSEKILFGKNIDRYIIDFDNKYCVFENNISVFKNHSIYTNEKILIQRIRNLSLKRRIIAVLDNEKHLCTNTLRIGYLKSKKYDLKFILGILNSNVINFLFLKQFLNKDIYAFQLQQIPIPKLSFSNQQPFIEKADLMLTLSKEFQLLAQKFSKYFSGQFKIEKLSGKLEKWYGLSFDEFIKEINKAIKTQKGAPLSKKDEFDWIDLFEENKLKANKLQNEIATTDNTIDAMVYELYGLSEEEIGIVENS